MDYSSKVNKIVVNEVWYGLINDDWEYKKIKYVFDERKETNNPIKTEELISLTMEDGVVPHSMKTGSGGNKPKEDLSKYKVVHPGDIVINPMNVIVGSVGLSKYYGVLSPVYITLTPKEDSGKVEFYDYLFSTELFQKSLIGMGNGILIRESESSGKLNTIRMRIPMEKLGNHFLPIPPREEQKQIVDFLDKKTTQIEKLIKKIDTEIELLKEQKTSLIRESGTKKG
jgi:Restriction endonuclease S subunits